MKLPNFQAALVEPAKLTDYLLSPTHPVGRTKAKFFTRVGFSSDSWEVLRDALVFHASAFEVANVEAGGYGVGYAVDGPLTTPSGRTPRVRTVWFVETGRPEPRFVTAYPLKGAYDD